MKIDTY